VEVNKQEALRLLQQYMHAVKAQEAVQILMQKLAMKYKVNPEKHQYDVHQGAFLPVVEEKK
jgi:hypothetical protein